MSLHETNREREREREYRTVIRLYYDPPSPCTYLACVRLNGHGHGHGHGGGDGGGLWRGSNQLAQLAVAVPQPRHLLLLLLPAPLAEPRLVGVQGPDVHRGEEAEGVVPVVAEVTEQHLVEVVGVVQGGC